MELSNILSLDLKMSTTCAEARPWNALFSSLYLAELAAAKQAEYAAAEFYKLGNVEAAGFYQRMAEEERSHAVIVQSMISEFIPPPQISYDVYDGKRCKTSGDANLAERLSIVHMVFEPSALAFLSFVKAEAENVFESDWAKIITDGCTSILWDESRHIRTGKEMIAPLLAELSDSELDLVKSGMKSHKAFLSAGIRTFFRGSAFSSLPKILNDRYDFSFRNAANGVINDII